jgi:hypothetical protein
MLLHHLASSSISVHYDLLSKIYWTVPELLFEKKRLILGLQQLLICRLRIAV